jgi:hypothetical protein
MRQGDRWLEEPGSGRQDTAPWESSSKGYGDSPLADSLARSSVLVGI